MASERGAIREERATQIVSVEHGVLGRRRHTGRRGGRARHFYNIGCGELLRRRSDRFPGRRKERTAISAIAFAFALLGSSRACSTAEDAHNRTTARRWRRRR